MSDKARFKLLYDGPAVADGTMPAKTLARSLLAMQDVMDRANELVNGDAANVQMKVACPSGERFDKLLQTHRGKSASDATS